PDYPASEAIRRLHFARVLLSNGVPQLLDPPLIITRRAFDENAFRNDPLAHIHVGKLTHQVVFGLCVGVAFVLGASGAVDTGFAIADASSRRRLSSGWMSGSAPVKLRNSTMASLLPPRESSVSRKRSPFSRFNPPCCLIHSTLSASSTSLQMYE